MMMMLPAEESMSNLTSAGSGEASVGSSQQQQPAKRKRCLPDPEAEVVALSPKALMATNRFACEVCGKGFQRDQNLQLHRRGHNLPWKLKQRPPGKEVRKKVYVCPEITCVHHDPSRALGDLTGIKKHFSRKHGEKKWKCDKCSKKYAVQSDWKAHSKVCGTREYRCDCGTLFSRRDSFITHRAFCDALAEESARQMTGNSFISNHTLMFSPLPPPQPPIPPMLQMQFPHLMKMTATSEAVSDDEGGNNNNRNNSFIITAQGGLHEFKKETQKPPFNMRTDIPAWLSCPDTTSATTATTSSFNYLDFNAPLYASRIDQEFLQQEKETAHHFIPAVTSTPHMSATALLQKAAQMGATMSLPTAIHSQMAGHDQEILTLHGSTSQGPYLQDITVFDHMGRMEEGSNAGGSAAGNDGLTRDFLGLRAFSHRDLFSMAGFESCMSTTSYEQQRKKSWQED